MKTAASKLIPAAGVVYVGIKAKQTLYSHAASPDVPVIASSAILTGKL